MALYSMHRVAMALLDICNVHLSSFYGINLQQMIAIFMFPY